MDKEFIIYVSCIIIAFFLWFSVKLDSYETKISDLERKKYFIKVDELKTKVKIEAVSNNTFIIKDWEELNKTEIKKIKEV